MSDAVRTCSSPARPLNPVSNLLGCVVHGISAHGAGPKSGFDEPLVRMRPLASAATDYGNEPLIGERKEAFRLKAAINANGLKADSRTKL